MLRLRHGERLIRQHILEDLFHPAGPAQGDPFDRRRLAEAEMHPHVVLRQVAAGAHHFRHLTTAGGADFDSRADTVTVAARPHGLNAQIVVRIPPVVAQQVRQAVVRLGWAQTKLGHLDAARRSFEEAAQLDPSLPEAPLHVGKSLYRMGRIEESVEQFQRAIELRPDYAEAHLSLGVAYFHLGELDKAAAAYERLIELDPKHERAHLYLSEAYRHQGRDTESRQLRARAGELRRSR